MSNLKLPHNELCPRIMNALSNKGNEQAMPPLTTQLLCTQQNHESQK